MIKNQKGNLQLAVVIIIVILALAAGVYLVQQRTNLLPKAASPTQTYTTKQQTSVKDDNELMEASSELGKTDLNSMDSELNQNNSDASNF